MSSEKKTAGTKEYKPAPVPKLRFPEFQGAEGWENTTLGDVTTKTDKRNKGGKSYPVYSISNKTGFTPQSEQFEGVDSEARGYDIAQYKLIESKTFAYNPARINVGSIGYSGKLNNVIISSLYVCFKAKANATDEFLLQFFETSDFEKSVNNHVEGGIRSYLFYENFARIGIPLPSVREQQKITEFLSSVDEVIAAQARKVDGLKSHKKGLMQQLFPREGETQPRRRFPEFQNAREWTSNTLGRLFETASGGTPSRTENTYWDGDVPWITTALVDFRVITSAEEFITKEGLENSSAKLFPKGTVLMAMYGQGKTRGQVALLEIEAATNQACVAILPREGIDPYFVFTNLAGRYEEIRRMSNSGGQENLSQALVQERLFFSFPSDEAEQRRITGCLSSLDALITAETQKLKALKRHKRGLMQQLFPSPEDAEA